MCELLEEALKIHATASKWCRINALRVGEDLANRVHLFPAGRDPMIKLKGADETHD